MSLRRQIEHSLALQEGRNPDTHPRTSSNPDVKRMHDMLTSRGFSIHGKPNNMRRGHSSASGETTYKHPNGDYVHLQHRNYGDYIDQGHFQFRGVMSYNSSHWPVDRPGFRSSDYSFRDMFKSSTHESSGKGPEELESHLTRWGHGPKATESVATTYYHEFYGNKTGINNRIPICPDCSLPVNETFGHRHPMQSGLSALQCQCQRRAA